MVDSNKLNITKVENVLQWNVVMVLGGTFFKHHLYEVNVNKKVLTKIENFQS